MIIVKETPLHLDLVPLPEGRYRGWLLERRARRLKSGGFRIPNTFWNRRQLENLRAVLDETSTPYSRPESIEFDSTGLSAKQIEVVSFLLSRPWKGGIVISSSPVAEKAQIVEAVRRAHSSKNVLVVVPKASDRERWEEALNHETSTVVTASTLRRQIDEIESLRWDGFVLADALLAKNSKSKIFEVLKRVCRASSTLWRVLFSEVLFESDITEAWGPLNIVWPRGYRSFWAFASDFAFIETSSWGSRIVGSRFYDWSDVFRDIIIRDRDLEPRSISVVEEVVPLTVEQHRVYSELQDCFLTEISEGVELSVVTRAEQRQKLEQVSSSLVTVGGVGSGKSDFVEQLLSSGEVLFPAIVWYLWPETGDDLVQRLDQRGLSVIHVREESDKNLLLALQSGDSQIGVVNLSQGSESLDLSFVRTAIYHDRSTKLLPLLRTFSSLTEGRVFLLVGDTPVEREVADTLRSTDLAVESASSFPSIQKYRESKERTL